MSCPTLEQLQSESFAVGVGFHSSPAALRRRLAKMPEVYAIRSALDHGGITESGIRQFVARLMKDFVCGEHFAYEDALSALCVAVEGRPTDFADEFLNDLAQLRLAELSLAIRVARECLGHRVSIAHRAAKTVDLSPPSAEMAFSVGSWESRPEGNGVNRANAVGMCEVR